MLSIIFVEKRIHCIIMMPNINQACLQALSQPAFKRRAQPPKSPIFPIVSTFKGWAQKSAQTGKNALLAKATLGEIWMSWKSNRALKSLDLGWDMGIIR